MSCISNETPGIKLQALGEIRTDESFGPSAIGKLQLVLYGGSDIGYSCSDDPDISNRYLGNLEVIGKILFAL